MGILSSMERSALHADVTWTPLDDRWYSSMAGGASTDAGVRVGPDSAMKYSAVWACMNIIARSIASLRPSAFRRLTGDDREPAREHWAYGLMRRPNRWQTTYEYLYLRTMYLLGRGNDVDQLYVDSRTGAVSDMWPLYPDTVRAERLPTSGLLRYEVSPPGGQSYRLLQDETIHVRDYAPDGIWGLSRIQLGAQGIGLGLATEAFRGRYFGNNAMPGLVLEHPGRLTPKAKDDLRESVRQATGGSKQFRPWVAEEGMKAVVLPISAKDSQLIESAGFQVADVARWFGVPLYMIGLEEKSTSWGSGIEEQKNGFVTFTLGPFLELYTQAFNRALFGDDDEYFIEFGLKALLRGNTKAHFEALNIATQPGGFMTRNEARRELNLNAGPEELDEFLDPLNTTPSGGRAVGQADPGAQARTFAIWAADVAHRIAGTEAAELGRRTAKAAADPERFRAWADGYFAEHQECIAQKLEPLSAGWHGATGFALPVHVLAGDLAARGRQAAEPCPAGEDLGEWKARRAQQIAGLIEAALAPRATITAPHGGRRREQGMAAGAYPPPAGWHHRIRAAAVDEYMGTNTGRRLNDAGEMADPDPEERAT
jgi:HK97 family phage portal protein